MTALLSFENCDHRGKRLTREVEIAMNGRFDASPHLRQFCPPWSRAS
jgi:hypothetical protein